MASEGSWNNVPINAIGDFLRLVLSVEDGFQRERLQDILLTPKHGLAVVVYQER